MTNNIYKRILLLLAFLGILISRLFYTVSSVSSHFEENFNGHFDNPLSWVTSNTNGLSFSSSAMNLSASSQTSFPYIRSSSPIIGPDDDTVEVKFKYIDSGSSFGNGFSITDVNPPLDTVMSYPSVFSQYTMLYVWQSPGNPYFHIVTFLCPVNNPNCSQGTPTLIYQTSSPDFNEHVFKITKHATSYSVFLDGVNYFDSAPTTRIASNVWFGHPEHTENEGTWTSLSIDYLKIGTSMPPFPYLSQKDPQWASEEYDTASRWSPGKIGIERWGCALTSVAMILQNYHIKSPTGEIVTPSNLNVWLKSQPDGYVREGFLNWLAITRYEIK